MKLGFFVHVSIQMRKTVIYPYAKISKIALWAAKQQDLESKQTLKFL